MRILVTGNAGAGKSTLAASLAVRMGLPCYGLDGIVWQAGWGRTPRRDRLVQEQAIAGTASWIVEGVSDLILNAADIAVFLDYPRRLCFWRAFRRNLPYLFRSRPGLPARCPEILIIATLVKIIWRFPDHVRPKILAACETQGKRVFLVRDDDELKRVVSALSLRLPLQEAGFAFSIPPPGHPPRATLAAPNEQKTT